MTLTFCRKLLEFVVLFQETEIYFLVLLFLLVFLGIFLAWRRHSLTPKSSTKTKTRRARTTVTEKQCKSAKMFSCQAVTSDGACSSISYVNQCCFVGGIIIYHWLVSYWHFETTTSIQSNMSGGVYGGGELSDTFLPVEHCIERLLF